MDVYKKQDLSPYKYTLPDEKIAYQPLEERSASKLLIFNKRELYETQFSSIVDHIPAESLLVFNETKVIPARMFAQTNTGAQIEILCLHPLNQLQPYGTSLHQTEGVQWVCMIGNAKKWKREETLCIQLPSYTLHLHRKDTTLNGQAVVAFTWTDKQRTFEEVLTDVGKMPLPPYIKRVSTKADDIRYQTVFGSQPGSVAAPTASLHFSGDLMQQLKDKAIKVVYTVLHVGAGTFLPVKAAQIGDHLMHAEQIALKQTFVASIIDQLERGQPIVCVGTTALRNLESLFWVAHYYSKKGLLPDHLAQWYPYEHDQDFSLGKASKLQILKHFNDYLLQSKKDVVILLTSLIIVPGYPFMMVDGLITNFHQPGSTLLMLVAAFVGKDQWQTIYDYALTHNFRFLSYGDGSLLWREKN